MARLGYAVRVLRQARGLTAAQLAAKAGISPTYLSLIESEGRVPPPSTLQKLAEALEVNVAVLQAICSVNQSPAGAKDIRALVASLRRLEKAERELKRKLGEEDAA